MELPLTDRVLAYRVTPQRYAQLHNGGGGLYKAGRWHDRGIACIYTSLDRGIAGMEVLPFLLEDSGPVPPFTLITYSVAGKDIAVLPNFEHNYPGWKSDIALTRHTGSAFFQAAEGVALAVPSAWDPKATNILLNPRHPAFQQAITVVSDLEPYSFYPPLLEIRQRLQQYNLLMENLPRHIAMLTESFGKEKAMELVNGLLYSSVAPKLQPDKVPKLSLPSKPKR